jgi:hypothetical protein
VLKQEDQQFPLSGTNLLSLKNQASMEKDVIYNFNFVDTGFAFSGERGHDVIITENLIKNSMKTGIVGSFKNSNSKTGPTA